MEQASSEDLSPTQARALFDVLTHHETYAEIESFKTPAAVRSYGPPFQEDTLSTSPVLQTLLVRFLLTLPGVRDLPEGFWPDKVEPLLLELAEANLSESFDKGDCGQRKTLATAVSSLIEYLARGKFGGLPRHEIRKKHDEYDLDSPEDLVAGFQDLLQELIYSDMLDSLIEKISETDDIADHSMLVQAAHRFILINVASFVHYTLVVSSKGPAILGLLESAHRLIPYTLVRQTLKVGNAATMMNGMVKIVLAKASVGAVTNWLGLSQGLAEGMNLMQTIVSTVLGWDNRGLKKQVYQLEKSKELPPKEQLQKLKDYIQLDRDEQENYRQESKKGSKTLTSVIIQPDEPLDPKTTQAAAKYLALELSIEDRNRLTSVLCHHNPDLITPTVRALVAAYEPVIRQIHEAVDLPAGLTDAENFINDLIAVASKLETQTSGPRVPVSSFVALFEKHQGAMHRFLHQLAKNGPELTGWYTDWLKLLIRQFRKKESADGATDEVVTRMSRLISYLSPADRESVIKELDAYAAYLASLSSSSEARAKALVAATGGVADNSSSSGKAGPGVFLAKWQLLLDDTEIGPAEHGAKKAGEEKSGGDGVGVEKEARKAPRTSETVRRLLPAFREMIREESEAEE